MGRLRLHGISKRESRIQLQRIYKKNKSTKEYLFEDHYDHSLQQWNFKKYVESIFSNVFSVDNMKFVDGSEDWVELKIYLIGELNTRDIEMEKNNIYNFILYLKENKYNLDYLEISYGEVIKDGKQRGIHANSDNIFGFSKKEINRIEILEDINLDK